MTKRKGNVLKIVILGDSGVGKSSLLGQYDRQEFDENIMVWNFKWTNIRFTGYCMWNSEHDFLRKNGNSKF